MKKHLFFLCALAVVAVACNVEESELNSDSRIVTVTATYESLPDSKSYYEDDGTFTWAESDEIAVYTTVNRFYRFTIVSIDEESDGRIASFAGTVNGSTTDVAVYPYIAGSLPTYDGNESMTVTLPESYAWVERIAYNPMVGFREMLTLDEEEEEEELAFNFKNLGALFKITLNNIPATATQVVFSTGKQITGTFTVNNLNDVASISAGEETEDDGVTFTFAELQEPANMVFYVPVPTGTYPYIAFEVKNANDETLWGFRGQRNQEMPRNKLMIMQPHTYPEGDTEKDVPPADYVEE